LAAICLETFMAKGVASGFDFGQVIKAAALEVRALNKVIDLNHYTDESCRASNKRHRPIGIGIMGLADVLACLGIAYGTQVAMDLATGIAAAVYYGSLKESTILASEEGPYASFDGSPMSQGLMQPDLWVQSGHLESGWEYLVEKCTGGAISVADWEHLRQQASRGVRNAYVTAYMPTATTSNIVGQNECFEPFTSNIYTRRTLAGEFFIVNRHLISALSMLGLWDEQMRLDILDAAGSVANISKVPEEIRLRFRTAREIHPSLIVRMAKSMAPWICQSMSMNLFLDEPSLPKILRFLVEGWKAGLKTGLYYCHTKPAIGAQKTSVQRPACQMCVV
jgi:ribonucleotide reductase alpha subunit